MGVRAQSFFGESYYVARACVGLRILLPQPPGAGMTGLCHRAWPLFSVQGHRHIQHYTLAPLLPM